MTSKNRKNTYRFGVVLHDEGVGLASAHEPLNERRDAEGEAELDVFGEIGAEVVAVESVEHFEGLVARDHVQSLLLLLGRQHRRHPLCSTRRRI